MRTVPVNHYRCRCCAHEWDHNGPVFECASPECSTRGHKMDVSFTNYVEIHGMTSLDVAGVFNRPKPEI